MNTSNDISVEEIFLRENKLLNLAPNFLEIQQYGDAYLNEIKRTFIHCLEENQFYEKFNHNLVLLRRYIKVFSIRFTKDDYVAIVKMLYGVTLHKSIDISVIINVFSEFKMMLRRVRHFSRGELEFQWKPLYDIWFYYTHSSIAKNGMIYSPKPVQYSLSEVIRLCSSFFPYDATEEIWRFARPHLYQPYPFTSDKYNGLKILKLMLPFYYNNHETFFKHVWPSLIRLLSINTWMSSCENTLMTLLGRAAATYVGLIDWAPYYDRLFTALLRSLKVRVAGVTKKHKFSVIKLYVDILVYAIRGPDDCEVISRFRQLFKAITHLYHPSSQAQNASPLLSLLHCISSALMSRFQYERIKKKPHPTLGHYPSEVNLSDGHIRLMTELMLPSCELAIFTKSRSEFGYVLHSLQKLACLEPALVVPACLRLFHDDDCATSESAVLQPHRALSSLAVTSMLHIPLLNSADRGYAEGKLAVFPLLRQLLNYININDLPKSYVAVICFGNLANMLWIEDLSEKANDPDLTDFEKKVALATTQFEDLMLQFFDKIFEIIEIGFTETGMVEIQKNSDFKAETLIDVVIMMIPSVSEDISRQILDKSLDFVFSHSFLSKEIQNFIVSIFSCILEKEVLVEYGVKNFMPKYMRYFNELIEDDCLLLGDRLDVKFVWLTNILPGFVKNCALERLNPDLLAVMGQLGKVYTRDAIKLFDLLLTYLLVTCTQPSTSLDAVYRLKSRDFHRSSWSGLISKHDLMNLCANSAEGGGGPKRLKSIPLTGPAETMLLAQLAELVIRPAIRQLHQFADLVRDPSATQFKLGHQQLKHICHCLFTLCRYMCDDMLYEPEPVHPLDPEQYGPLPQSPVTELTQFVTSLRLQHRAQWPQGLALIVEVRQAVLAAVKAIRDACLQTSSLPVTITDLQDLFKLLGLAFSLSKESAHAHSRYFLERRFDSFLDPVRPKSNTPLNWVLLLVSWQQRDPLLAIDARLHKPLTVIVVEAADLLLSFLLQLSNTSLQQFAIDCLNALCQTYLQLAEYVIHRFYTIVVINKEPLDENTHNSCAQLLSKILRNRCSPADSMTFVYKLTSIFVSMTKTQYIEQSTNNDWNKKLFELQIHLITTFYITAPVVSYPHFRELAAVLRHTTAVQSSEHGSLISVQKSADILRLRQQLYFACLEHSFSVYLDLIPAVGMPGSAAAIPPNGSTVGFVKHYLNNTLTWQSIIQMTVVLPLHPEVPIPVKFLELSLLILFSPSRELSSHACNQINIVVWLLRKKPAKQYIPGSQLLQLMGCSDTSSSTAFVDSGPRSDNKALIIDQDTDFWSIPPGLRTKHFNDGWLWWPDYIKLRPVIPDIQPQQCSQQRDYSSRSGADLCDSNLECWQLLCRTFESDHFHRQLRLFLLDLGSQFLREEDAISSPSQQCLELLVHSFSLDQLVCSILICVGPARGLPLLQTTYQQLMNCTDANQVYANRLAAKLVAGVLVSSRHWPEQASRSFFDAGGLLQWMVDTHLAHACRVESLGVVSALLESASVSHSGAVDVRQLLPLYRHLAELARHKYLHDAHRELVCAHFLLGVVKLCSWRTGPGLTADLIWLWRQFVASHTEKLRRQAAKTARLLLVLEPLARLPSVGFQEELCQLLAVQTRAALTDKGLEPSLHTLRALRLVDASSPSGASSASAGPPDIEPEDEMETVTEESLVEDVVEEDIDEVEDVDTDEDGTTAAATGKDLATEQKHAHKIVANTLWGLTDAFSKFGERVPLHLLELFGITLDLIPVRDKVVLYTQLRQCALVLSNLLIPDCNDQPNILNCDSLLGFLEGAVQHRSWRVRLVATKMAQIISFNNLFVLSRPVHLKRLVALLLVPTTGGGLLHDPQIEVRKEAGNMLAGLMQCGLFTVNSAFLADMTSQLAKSRSNTVRHGPQHTITRVANSDPNLLRAHSAVIALCAFIQAHPFDIPAELPAVLTVLCCCVTRSEPVSSTAKETLARFKKSHQESWHLERHHFTEDQLCALTDVLVSPSYYA